MEIFTRRFLNRVFSFGMGFMGFYAFANPDLDRVWELHPAFEQKDYAFLNFYEVDSSNFKKFEKTIRGLTRYLQRRSGYGYTRLVKLEELNNPGPLSNYQYIGVQTWFTPALMKSALDSSFSQKIISNLKMKNPYNALMYKIVVDDSSFSP